MKKQIGLVLFCVSMLDVSCATLKAKWNALTPLQKVATILDAADWGVRADHDIWNSTDTAYISDKDLALFRQFEQIIRNTVQDNPQTKKEVYVSLASNWLKTLPADSKLVPYVNALVQALVNNL